MSYFDLDNELIQLNFTLESVFGPTKLVLKAKRLNYTTIQDVLNDKENITFKKNERKLLVLNFLDSFIKYISKVTFFENCFSKFDEFDENYLKLSNLIKLLNNQNLTSIIKLSKEYTSDAYNLEGLIEIYKSHNLDYFDKLNIELFLNFLCKNLHNSDLILSQLEKHAVATNLEELLKQLEAKIENLNSKSKDVLVRRFVKNETLEFIAKDYNVTRERIRQIESKALQNLNFTLDTYNSDIFKIIGDIYILKGDILDYVLEYYQRKDFYKIFVDSKTNIKIAINKSIYKEVKSQIQLLENKLENKVAINVSDIELNLPSKFIFEYLTLLHNYHNGYIDKKVTITAAISEIMKNYEQDINLKSDEDINFILSELKNKYKINLETKSEGHIRNIERAMNVNCLIVGARAYRHIDKIKKIKKELIDEIIKFIKLQKITTGKAIYSVYGLSLRKYDISSPQAIYSYLRYFFQTDFKYGGVSLAISVKNTKISFAELIKDFILSEKRPVNKTEILNKFPAVTNPIINNLSLYDSSFAYWGNNNYFLRELIKINDSQKNQIWKILNSNKIIKAAILINKLNELDNKLLDKNFIHNEDSLFFFLKAVYGDKVRKKEGYRLIYLL